MGDIFAGRYELVDPLGEGGAGVVWRVWDRRRQLYCAAKVLRQVDAASLLRFMREQSLRLEHQHILAPTGWAGEDEKVLFTMPIATGGSVATLISDFGPLPVRLAAVLLDQLLAALDAIHAEGIIHRDVKPANLLLDATGTGLPHLWLGDFGVAAAQDAPRLTEGPFALGTPGYLAPECLRHGWQPEARADLYAAGMCAAEMLTGLKPEPEVDVSSTLAGAQRDDPVGHQLTELIGRLGHPALTERWSTASQARTALKSTGLLDYSSSAEVLHDVEVFNHVPSLPPGWNDDGPAAVGGQHSPAQPRPTSVAEETAPSVPTQPKRAEATTNILAAAPKRRTRPEVPKLGIHEPESQPQNLHSQPATPAPMPNRHRASGSERAVAVALILMGSGLVLLAAAVYLVFG